MTSLIYVKGDDGKGKWIEPENDFGSGSLATFLLEYFMDQELPPDWYLNIETKPPNYREYIQSAEWKERARVTKIRSGMKCERCGKAGNFHTLQAHHKSYKNLGHERRADLMCLCADCHKYVSAARSTAQAPGGAR